MPFVHVSSVVPTIYLVINLPFPCVSRRDVELLKERNVSHKNTTGTRKPDDQAEPWTQV